MNAIKVIHNPRASRFESMHDGHLAELQYRMRKSTIFFMHTWVPNEIAGKGVGSALAKAGLEYARAKQQKIAVLCPFVGAYLKRHPEYNDLLDPEYHQPIHRFANKKTN